MSTQTKSGREKASSPELEFLMAKPKTKLEFASIIKQT